MSVLLIENNEYKNFYPITKTKFLWDLSFGLFTPYSRYKRQFHNVKVYSARLEQEPFSSLKSEFQEEIYNPDNTINTIVSSQYVPFENLSPQINRIGITKDGKFVYIRLEEIKKDIIDMIINNDINPLLSKYRVKEIEGGIFLNNFVDLIKYNAKAIEYETYLIKSDTNFISPNDNVFVDKTSKIQQFVSLQSDKGPIIIDRGALIKPFSVLEGPVYIGKNTVIENAVIRDGSTIKNECIINGRIENSIIENYTTKRGDGYIGSSYVGSWVFIDNNTNVCDEKINSGPIKIKYLDNNIETNIRKFGAIICDFTRIGTGLTIKEGSIVNYCSSLFYEDSPIVTNINQFSWGKNNKYDCKKFIEDLKNYMKRRNFTLSESYEKFLMNLYNMN